MPEDIIFKPENYSLGKKATFENTTSGIWIASQSNPSRPLEVISKKDSEINFWDWEPWNLIHSYILTKEEFNRGDYYHIVR